MFIALLDTNVLWPSLQRDFLLSLAIEHVYRPVWSSVILDELEYHETKKLQERYGIPQTEAKQRAAHLLLQMRSKFDDAEVHGWEPLEGSYGLPDPNDEHVVAAAHMAGAGVIVTHNLKDFPPKCLPSGMSAILPHEFALDAVRLSPQQALSAVTEMARRSGRRGPRRTPSNVIQLLQTRYGMDEAMIVLQHEKSGERSVIS